MIKPNFMEKLLDGVEVVYRPLEQCCYILDNKRKPVTKSARVTGEYPYYGANGIQDYVSEYIFDGTYVLVGEDGSVITPNGNPVVNWAEGKIWVNNHAHIIEEKEGILLKYLYHYIQTIDVSSLIHGNIPKLTGSDFRKLSIPIPPIKIQCEIVQILDTSTLLTAGLTAELTARKKQYSYYRDQLLSFEDGEVEWKALGEIGEFTRGKRFVKTDMLTEGFPCIHYGEMYTHYNIWADTSKSFVSHDLASNLRIAEHGDIVIVAAGETIEDIGRGTAWLGNTGVVIHDACFAYRSFLNPKYVSYFLRTKYFHDQIKKYISSGKISAINANGLGKAKIPVPYPNDPNKSMDEQSRIASILDKFDVLTTSITEGLPREIELRQKQYEYYRNMLLSFPKEEVEA